MSSQGQADKAIAFLDRFLIPPAGLDRPPLLLFSSKSRGLLLSRAQIYSAQGRWENAERDIEELFQLEPAEQMPDQSRPMACLLRGMLRERRGDTEGALVAWRQGRLADREHRVRGTARLADMILASLIGEMSDAEADAIGAELFAGFAESTPLAAMKNLLRLPPAVMREAWRTPRGHDAAMQIAFRQVSLPQLVRLPAVVLAVETARQTCFGGDFLMDEEAIIWDLAQGAFDGYATGQLKAPQVVQTFMTLKGHNDYLGWQGLKPALSTELRGPSAYMFGCRFLRLGKPEESRSFFQTAQEEAPVDSALSRLARGRLQMLPMP